MIIRGFAGTSLIVSTPTPLPGTPSAAIPSPRTSASATLALPGRIASAAGARRISYRHHLFRYSWGCRDLKRQDRLPPRRNGDIIRVDRNGRGLTGSLPPSLNQRARRMTASGWNNWVHWNTCIRAQIIRGAKYPRRLPSVNKTSEETLPGCAFTQARTTPNLNFSSGLGSRWLIESSSIVP